MALNISIIIIITTVSTFREKGVIVIIIDSKCMELYLRRIEI